MRSRILKPYELEQLAEIHTIIRHSAEGKRILADWQMDLLERTIVGTGEQEEENEVSPSPNRKDDPTGFWMHRFLKHLVQHEDKGTKLGCWIWDGASQGKSKRKPQGTRPVYNEDGEVLPVRAKMLDIWQKYLPSSGSRISTTCGHDLCVRPEHLLVAVAGRGVIWSPQILHELQRKDAPAVLPDPLAYAVALLDETPDPVQDLQETSENLQDSASLEALSNLMCEQTLDLQIQLEHLAARLA